jgi:predicted membrane protein
LEKEDSIMFSFAIFFLVMMMISLIYRDFFSFGIFMAAALGITFLRQSKGLLAMCIGLFIYVMSVFEYWNKIPWYGGIMVMLSGILILFWERKKLKEKVRKILVEKGFAEDVSDIKVSFLENPRYISLSWRSFGTYFNPSKRAVKVRIGRDEKIYFYDFRKNELNEAGKL